MPRKKKESTKVTATTATTATKAAKGTTATKATKGNDKIAAAMAALGKAFGADKLGLVDLNAYRRSTSHPHLPTGSIVVDFVIGGRLNEKGIAPCPGLPKGRLVNLYGKESSGKTTLALQTAALVIRAGGQVCFIDWENAIELAYAEAIGIPMKSGQVFLSQPENLEIGMGVCYAMAKTGIPLIIIDSVSAGVPKSIVDQTIEKMSDGKDPKVGIVARKWSGFLPKLKNVINKTGTVVIGVSQLRKTINTSGYGPRDTAAGGEAWKYYSDLRLRLRSGGVVKDNVYNALSHEMEETAIAGKTVIKIDKCKVAPSQGAEGTFYVRFGVGIDDVLSVMDIGKKHGLVTASAKGGWWGWTRSDGTSLKIQGSEKFRRLILETPGAWEELYKTTVARMNSSSGVPVAAPEDADVIDLDFITGGDK